MTQPTLLSLATLETEILKGLKRGMDRHWLLSKDTLEVKPEYLLTVFVADHLCDVLGLETSIRLERPTPQIIQDIWLFSVGWKRYFREYTKWKGRNGKVDIYIKRDEPQRCAVIELKNLDPPAVEVQKDVTRLCDLLAIQPTTSSLEAGYLAFPTTKDWTKSLLKVIQSSITGNVQLDQGSEFNITGDDPEDGLPAYFANVARITRLPPPSGGMITQ